MYNKILITRASPEDAEDFLNLLTISAPLLFPIIFGHDFKIIFKKLFIKPGNLFSFEFVHKAIVSGSIGGMILGYDWLTKKKFSLRTGKLIIKYIGIKSITYFPRFLKLSRAIGILAPKEYYISNIAVYPEYRRKGIGTKLISWIEKEARNNKIKRLVLDVEKENSGAIRLYRKLGFSIASSSHITFKKWEFRFYRMCKEIENYKQ